MTDIARTSFPSLSGAIAARPDAYARARYQAANDRYAHFDRDTDLRARGRAPVLEAWSDGARYEGAHYSIEDHLPRATFAAQLFAQQDPGARAHVEDHAGVSASYVTAEQRPSQPRTGSNISIEL